MSFGGTQNQNIPIRSRVCPMEICYFSSRVVENPREILKIIRRYVFYDYLRGNITFVVHFPRKIEENREFFFFIIIFHLLRVQLLISKAYGSIKTHLMIINNRVKKHQINFVFCP